LRWLAVVALALGVAGVVAWTHWPVLSAQALTLDDDLYLRENPLVQNPSWSSAVTVFREVLAPSRVIGYMSAYN
jgi:hypothetical protein